RTVRIGVDDGRRRHRLPPLRGPTCGRGTIMSTDLDALLGSADPPLIVVTTAAEGERAGCLVGFHSQASIGPQRYCFWLSKANHTRSEEHTSELQSRFDL